ncbi:AraC family transcriptional regulator [Aeoliella mucimassa]|uniref:Xylose operon regulatory protein n=1 Tax=Aeoliella mucimassa TaxID=2527972 RepID=A0A518AR73_9BACT|nr:DNA-binding transcriptional regulator [Aeoliella mucimassa]QDU57206.1 Xylose operon regulatory protein [Aeoliella mucimassa]
MRSLPRVALLLDGARGWDAGLLRGLARYANLHRSWQFLRPAATYYQRFSGLADTSLQALLKHRPDAVIMHESEMSNHLVRSGIPTIVIPIRPVNPDRFYITCDNAAVGEIAAEHLVGQGLTHFAFVGYSDVRWSQQRLEAYRDYLVAQGHPVHQRLVPLGSDDSKRAQLHRGMIHWLRELPKPIGVFVGNDDLARALSELCLSTGITIPDEISLIGTDNDELICELNSPPLTSIPFATEKAGYETAELLECLLRGRTPESNTVNAAALQVVVRRSTDRLAIEDIEVVKAVKFIREHVSQIIQVSDVVKATMLSQRTLHNRFKAKMGHSIRKEINRERAKYVAGLLESTSLSISQIAWKLGYADDAHLVRFFQREMGQTPGAYRRQLT